MENESTIPTTGIRKETSKSAVILSRVYVNEFQKEGTKTAELRQEVTIKSFYPSKKTESSLQNGLADNSEFGFKEQEFFSKEERVAWVLVPANMPDAEVAKRVANDNTTNSCIYRKLSNEPILDENQSYAITANLKTMDDFANSQVVRYPENEATKANGTAGKIIKDTNDNPQYRRTFYWKTPKEDIDVRDANKVYVSDEIEVELKGASVLEGQSL